MNASARDATLWFVVVVSASSSFASSSSLNPSAAVAPNGSRVGRGPPRPRGRQRWRPGGSAGPDPRGTTWPWLAWPPPGLLLASTCQGSRRSSTRRVPRLTVAAQLGTPPWYLVVTVLGMLGETAVDRTTETLVPELVPRSQFDLAGSTRVLSFLLGGLSGYAASSSSGTSTTAGSTTATSSP